MLAAAEDHERLAERAALRVLTEPYSVLQDDRIDRRACRQTIDIRLDQLEFGLCAGDLGFGRGDIGRPGACLQQRQLRLCLGQTSLRRLVGEPSALNILLTHRPPVLDAFDQSHLHLRVRQVRLRLAHARLRGRDVLRARLLFEFRQARPRRIERRALYAHVRLQVAVVKRKELLSCLDTIARLYVYSRDHAGHGATEGDVLAFGLHEPDPGDGLRGHGAGRLRRRQGGPPHLPEGHGPGHGERQTHGCNERNSEPLHKDLLRFRR